MARAMQADGEWLMPMYTANEPFLGKPPLSFWASALSLQALGEHAFAARLPSWLFAAIGLLALARFAGRGEAPGPLAALISASCMIGYIAFGKVQTDTAFALGATLAMVGFWFGIAERHNGWYAAAVAGLAVGLLAKGPTIFVIVGAPLVTWLACHGQLWPALTDKRVAVGGLLLMIIGVPWFLMAEAAEPGFLRYYIVDEHIQRYLDPGFQDLYGNGHEEPYGKIFAFLGWGLLPWALLLPWLTEPVRALINRWRDPWLSYVILWATVPLVFFALSSNVLDTYVLPSLPAWAILFAWCIRRRALPTITIVLCALLVPAMKFAQNTQGDRWYSEKRNQHPIIEAYLAADAANPAPIYYVGKRRFSGEFYARRAGKVVGHTFNALSHPPARPYYAAHPLDAPLGVPPDCARAYQGQQYELRYCPEVQVR